MNSTPDVVGDTTLIDVTFPALVPAPAFFALAHFDYQPGAFFPPAAGAGPVGFRVLTGTLEFEAQGVAIKTSATTGEPVEISAGQRFQVTVDDQLVMPGGVMHSAKTIGSAPARILGLAIFGAAPAQEFPPGITFGPLVLGEVRTLPAAPAQATVAHRALASGQDVRLGGAGPQLIYLDSGRATVHLDVGTGAYWHGSGPFGQPGVLTANTPVDLSENDGLLVQSGAALRLDARRDVSMIVGTVTAPSAPTNDEMTSRVRQLALRFVYDLWQSGDAHVLEELLDPGFVNHTRLPGQQPGRAGIGQFVQRWHRAFPDGIITIDLLVEQGHTATISWTSRGYHRGPFLGVSPTGKYTTISGITALTCGDGRVSTMWQYLSILPFLTDADALPNPAANGNPRTPLAV